MININIYKRFSFARYSEKCFTQIYSALYGDPCRAEILWNVKLLEGLISDEIKTSEKNGKF